MRRRVEKYLERKENSKYDNLDRILEMYVNGQINKLLSNYAEVRVYPSFYKSGKAIQLEYRFHNIYVVIDFFEDKYCTSVYHAGIGTDELENLLIAHEYQGDFDLRILIDQIDSIIQNHPELENITFKEKKRKTYSLISGIALCLPIVIFGSIGIYCAITENTVKGNMWWGICLIIIPLIVWFAFGVKSKRRK